MTKDHAELPFPVGSVVFLKSGGPPLTVADYNMAPIDAGLVSLEWFAGDVLRRDVIHKDCLTTGMVNGRG